MILFRLQIVFYIFLFFLSCSRFANRKDYTSTDNSIHLVLNSTGYATEFCVFEIESQNNECKASNLKSYPKCVEYFSENANSPSLNSKDTLDQIYKGLAEMELSRPNLKHSIKNVGYITTGEISSSKDPQSKEILKDVESYFKAENLKIITKAFSAEEEAKITMTAIQNSKELNQSDKEIALVQIGSESVELVFGGNSKVTSSKIGIQVLLEELSNIKPDINSCRLPISDFFKSESSSFEKCKSFISENLNKSKKFAAFDKIKLGESYQVYSTGSTWNYYYPNKSNISLNELNQTGYEYCSLTISEIQKKGIKKKGIKKKHAYNLCYSLAYKAVLAETLGIENFQILQKEIFLKSLSKSKLLFSEICN